LHVEHENEVPVVVIARGSVNENVEKARRARLGSPYLLQPGWSISKKFGIFATPVAFLIDADGRVAQPVALGADNVMELARVGVQHVSSPT
jgi:hypothetical protein